jgi:hypothetical protein
MKSKAAALSIFLIIGLTLLVIKLNSPFGWIFWLGLYLVATGFIGLSFCLGFFLLSKRAGWKFLIL